MKALAVLLSISLPYALAAWFAVLTGIDGPAKRIGDRMEDAVYELTNWRTMR